MSRLTAPSDADGWIILAAIVVLAVVLGLALAT